MKLVYLTRTLDSNVLSRLPEQVKASSSILVPQVEYFNPKEGGAAFMRALFGCEKHHLPDGKLLGQETLLLGFVREAEQALDARDVPAVEALVHRLFGATRKSSSTRSAARCPGTERFYERARARGDRGRLRDRAPPVTDRSCR